MHGRRRRNPLGLQPEYRETCPKSWAMSSLPVPYTKSFRRDPVGHWIAEQMRLYLYFRLSRYRPRLSFSKTACSPASNAAFNLCALKIGISIV